MTALLVSDTEREYTVGLLRGHHLSGRLTAEEFEERVAETWSARYADDLWQALRWLPVERPPAPPLAPARPAGMGTAVVSLVLGLLGLFLVTMSLGLLFMFSVPLSVSAWGLGRSASRSNARARRVAVAGQVLGIVGTLLAIGAIAGWAALIF